MLAGLHQQYGSSIAKFPRKKINKAIHKNSDILWFMKQIYNVSCSKRLTPDVNSRDIKWTESPLA